MTIIVAPSNTTTIKMNDSGTKNAMYSPVKSSPSALSTDMSLRLGAVSRDTQQGDLRVSLKVESIMSHRIVTVALLALTSKTTI